MRGPPEHLFLPLDYPNLHTTEMQEAFTSHDFFQLMGVKSYQISIPTFHSTLIMALNTSFPKLKQTPFSSAPKNSVFRVLKPHSFLVLWKITEIRFLWF